MGRLLLNVFMIWIILVFWGIYNAQSSQTPPALTPTAISSDDLRVFPGDLVCDKQEKPANGIGPTWMGITIGQSTLDDVAALLATFRYEYKFIDDDDDDIRFVIWDFLQAEEGEPTSIRLCLSDNTVQAMAIGYNYPLNLPRPNLTDYIAQFGQPNALTWTDNPGTRVAFWFEQGFASEVIVIPNNPDYSHLEPTFGRIGEELYFPYQQIDGYENRWPYNQTRQYNQFLSWPYEGRDDYGPENPFDFAAIIATITAEPSRTPTPLPSPTTSP